MFKSLLFSTKFSATYAASLYFPT